jgi:subtilisin-like proprotein convertase family protein
VGDLYDYQVDNTINYQGWGMTRADLCLPSTVSNAFTLTVSNSIYLFDQSPTNALATGQRHTRNLAVGLAGATLPLRVTLAWTDPPGNPAAGVKLVNDLDLVVTNLATGEIFFGNDFPSVQLFNNVWDTNDAPRIDAVNNVENVYLAPALGTNYAITVFARRVNVNAVTAHPNDVVQDYALVITSGDGEVTNAFILGTQTFDAPAVRPETVFVTNTIVAPDFVAAFYEEQRLGASTPLLSTTNGMTNQWKFFVVTNTTTFTNATFLISQQTDLSLPREGVFARPPEATRTYADLDLYVAPNQPDLLILSPPAVDASFKSLSRNELSGDEYVIFADSSLNQIYYVGVKSEDQLAAEFDFFAIFSLFPLGAEDANGFVRAYPLTGYPIPEGPPSNPGGTRFVAITLPSTTSEVESVRRVIVTNNVTHENYGDVIATVDHNSRVVVLDNKRDLTTSPIPVPGPYPFLYDDSGEGDFPFAIPPDGPGSFEDFIGESPGGTWYFTYSDDALTQLGEVNDVRILVERQCESDCTLTNSIGPNSWRYFSRNIPVEATNFTVCVQVISPDPKPLQLYIRKGARPTTNLYDFTRVIDPQGCLTIDKTTLPPLQSGRYFIGVFNPNPGGQEFTYQSIVLLGETPAAEIFRGGVENAALLDDAVTNYSQIITNDAIIAQVDVGLRIDHPRVSDLAVTLVSPRGTRVLLVENRGRTNDAGFGSTLTVTNFAPVVVTNGGPNAVTNIFDTGATFGTLTIDYDFFDLADRLTVYYEGTRLVDTGLVSNKGRQVVEYGPGSSAQIDIVINEGGNTNSATKYQYTVSSVNTVHDYLVFTDNTNFTTTPIKFATPPFVGTTGVLANISDFEAPVIPGDYLAPLTGTPDGWDVLTNTVTVVTNAAYTGSQSLALGSGTIRRTLPTILGRTYRLGYAYRNAPSLDGLVGWWPGDTTGSDIVNGNTAALFGGATYGVGEVAQGFSLDGVDDRIVAAATPPLNFGPGADFSIEGWIQAFPSTNDFGVMTILDKRSAPNTFECLGIAFYLQDGKLAVQMSDGVVPNTTWHAYPSAGPDLQDGLLHHVAATVQRNSTTGGKLYVDGVLVLTFDPTLEPGSLVTPAPLRIGNHDDPALNCYFKGIIDEIAIFNRALSSSEVQGIYAAGAAGKCGLIAPPAVCGPGLGAQIAIPGQVTNSFLGITNWQQGGLLFTANSTNTVVELSPLSTNAPSGVLVDSFTLAASGLSRFVLPEETLKAFEDQNAFGEWKLEIIDTRTGASNNVALVDWQLRFIFQTDTAAAVVLTPGQPISRTVCPGQIDYFIVDVPSFSRFATNWLITATGPLNVYFNQSIRPTGTNTVPPDYTLLALQTNGIVTLSTDVPAPPGLPVLQPGQRYYLGIKNPGTNSCITYSFLIDFDLATFPSVVNLTNGVPFCAVNPGPAGVIDYYRFNVSSNALRAQFELNNLTGDLTLFLRRGLPPTFNVFDTFSANVFTNDEVITLFDFSTPVALAPGDWYLGAGNVSGLPVGYCATAYEWPVYGTNIVITNAFVSSNSFCLTWTSLPGVNYTVEGLTNITSTNWFTVASGIKATGYATTACVALPSPFQYFRVREGGVIDPYFPPPFISVIRRTFQGIVLTWGGPVDAQYQVQWSPTLTPPVWTTFPNPPAVTSTTGLFQFLDDGTQTIPPGLEGVRYYRLILLP